jgi:transcriptional regulator GlxA family with amidase domain
VLVAILLFDRVTALDAVGPYEVLSRVPGVDLRFVANEARIHRTDSGMLGLVADHTIDAVTAPDVVVVPGGPGTRALMGDEVIAGWIRDAHATSTWTASVCTGSLLLGAAGILQGVRASTHWSARERLARTGAVVSTSRVTVDGKVITAAGVSAGIDMGLTLVGLLCGPAQAEEIQLVLEYDPQPPYGAGSLESAPAEVVARVMARP